MATKFEKYQHLVDKFNKKYNVNFSYTAFESEVGKYQNFSENFLSQGGDVAGQRYKKNFADLYTLALTNYADRKIDKFSSTEMLKEYVEMMNGYKEIVNAAGNNIKKWPKVSELVTKVQANLQDEKKGFPDTKEDFIIKRYMEGKLPLRQMRAEAKKLIDDKCTDPKKLSLIWGYAKALEKINGDRPRWWRILNFPRNNAEQRDMKNFKKIISQRIKRFRPQGEKVTDEERKLLPPDLSENSINSFTTEFLIMRATYYDTSLADAKNEINDLSEKLKVDENAIKIEEPAEAEKVSVVVEELAEQNERVKNETVDRHPITTHYLDEIKKEEIQKNIR